MSDVQPPQQDDGTSRSAPQAWSISFTSATRRKVTKKEREAMNGGNKKDISPTPSDECDDAGAPRSGTSSPATPAAEVLPPIDRSVAVPINLPTTFDDLSQRTCLDLRRLVCVAKQYPRSCGITSLTSVWNYLYSVAGTGDLPVVSQEEIMTILGFEPPFENIRWGPFTGNVTLMRWFHAINAHFKVRGKAHYLYKAHGLGRTIGLAGDDAKEVVKTALRNPSVGIIYHCHNHYMVPVGFQEVPRAQFDFYKPSVPASDCDTTIFIGEVSRGKHAGLHAKKWRDIETDINTQFPNFFNIRQSEKGVQTREKCKKVGGNLHCLLCFRKDIVEEDVEQFLEAQRGVEEEEEGQDDVLADEQESKND